MRKDEALGRKLMQAGYDAQERGIKGERERHRKKVCAGCQEVMVYHLVITFVRRALCRKRPGLHERPRAKRRDRNRRAWGRAKRCPAARTIRLCCMLIHCEGPRKRSSGPDGVPGWLDRWTSIAHCACSIRKSGPGVDTFAAGRPDSKPSVVPVRLGERIALDRRRPWS